MPVKIAAGEADIAGFYLMQLNERLPKLAHCACAVEGPHRHHHKGKLYNVRVDISVPGKDVVVDRTKPTDHAHEDVYVAVRDAFDAAVRRLEDQTRKMRGSVKTHAGRPTAEG